MSSMLFSGVTVYNREKAFLRGSAGFSSGNDQHITSDEKVTGLTLPSWHNNTNDNQSHE